MWVYYGECCDDATENERMINNVTPKSGGTVDEVVDVALQGKGFDAKGVNRQDSSSSQC